MSSALVLANGGSSNEAGPSRPSLQRQSTPPYRSSLLPFTDALPYYDQDLEQDASLRARIDREIRREMEGTDLATNKTIEDRIGPAFDFSENLSKLVEQEMERVLRREPPAAGGLDMSRYTLPSPPEGEEDSELAWDGALRNSSTQLALQEFRMSNIELLKAYGANAWRLHNFQQEAMLRSIDSFNDAARARTTGINRKRKELQTRAGGEKLNSLQNKWAELISSNLQVEVANITSAHEVEVLRLKRQKLEKELEALDREELKG
ncbi:hypothetical protein K437DRAFT_265304 [Tilletiaria anomala UBC 951]|uniref:Breast carcinoma amplified sequence 2 n=1 Tax=Tilletiaria anomala (strain ATCC 24038 / CBS 436.72 / UBC 951) TaxID=1037660 RepID=A0A066VCY2_TILAU|nr:uncharacterized protein K437DRAFT_265304 [Tilletiaria anomala UBC 951]KDN36420.1 hypothetical protein K437DRAFT_265304 [Tilletiaria anomala UBC 951]